MAVVNHIGGRYDFFSSLPFFLSSFCPSDSRFYEYLRLYALYGLVDSSSRPGTYSVRHPLVMCHLDATRTLFTKDL